MAAPMRLTLRLDNVDRLESGGPLFINLERRGCQAGRNPSMDWVLPDSTRSMSSHHFDILFRDDAYWLTDVSSNGTYLQGQRHRLQGPVRISDGDRFLAGPYIIAAELRPAVISGPAAPPPMTPPRYEPLQSGPSVPVPPPLSAGPDASADPSPDIWDLVDTGPAWQPEPQSAVNHHGYSAPSQAVVPSQSGDGWNPPSNSSLQAFRSVEPDPAWGGPTAPSKPTPVPQASVAAPPDASSDGGALFAAFCHGAGLDPSNYPGLDVEATMRQAGRALKVTSREVMRMLRDRSKVKEAIAAGERTMLEPRENNPLKFAKDPGQAVEALFMKPREGYLAGSEALEAALDELRRHQMAVFAAMQAALADVLEGLSPEEIEAVAGGGLFGGASKTRWDAYVRRWEEKATQGENGMLDPFIRAFAKAYAEAASR